MNLLHWLQELADCQHQPERIDFDGVQDALDELRQRIDETHHQYTPEGNGELPPEAATVLDMAAVLEQVADRLEEFLNSGLFYHVTEALELARDLVNLRDGLRQRVEDSNTLSDF